MKNIIIYYQGQKVCDTPCHFTQICSEAVVLQGAGFAPLPGTCDAYILCRFYGDIPISMSVKRCPIGLHWNQDKLTCDYAINVGCISGMVILIFLVPL